MIETTHEGWFSRILGSIKTVLLGLFLAAIAVPLLFWNEGRAVHTARSLEEGAGSVIAVDATKVDAANDGKLVHIRGKAAAGSKLIDSAFGVEADALSMHRDVEMFQWEETSKTKSKKKLGGSKVKRTRYSYNRVWDDSLIDSQNFKEAGHDNPPRMPHKSKQFQASGVTLGAFKLSSAHVAKLGRGETLDVSKRAANGSERGRPHDGMLFLGEDPQQPRIGDVRIGYTAVKPGVVSLIGQQVGDTFKPWEAPSGDGLLMLERGDRTADEMFSQAETANTVLTWGLRVVGFFCMFLGVGLVFKPIAVMGDVVPFVGSVLQFGVTLFAFLISTVVSSVVVAVAWVVYRPLLGVGLLLIAGLALFALVKVGRRKPATA